MARHVVFRVCVVWVMLAAAWAEVPCLGNALADDAADWPQFHGPDRDNKSDETGLLKQWPPEGPKLLWTAKGIGYGFSSVAILDGMIYTTGNIGKDTVISALNLDGKIQWQVKNGPAWENPHPGTRGTPTLEGERLYHEGAYGDVLCLDTGTQKTVWSLNILEKFKGRNISWGLSESLLIDGDHVICCPGGEEIAMVALDKNTGDTVWTCTGVGDKPGYSSPLVFDCGGLRQIATMTARAVIGVNAKNGKLLWRYEHVTPYDMNILDPIFHDGCIFISTRVTGSRFLRLNVDGEKVSVQQVWETKDMDNEHGAVVSIGDHVYGGFSTINKEAPWVCLDLNTGKRLYAERCILRSTLTYADGLFYVLNHNRDVALVCSTPEEFKVISQFALPPNGEGPTWAHPVVCGGRFYVRHGDFLYCYDVKAN